jgi:hypothetical protein
MAKPHLLVLVANSVNARILRRDPGSGEWRTCLRIENGPVRGEAHSAPGADRRRAERIRHFVTVLAAHLRELLREHPGQGLVLAAPSRMLAPLLAELGATGAVRATTARDLVKFHDHEVVERLAAELHHAEGGFAAA